MGGRPTQRIEVQAATADRWGDVVEVFESGAIANRCWCQWVRKTQEQARQDGPEGNRASLQALIEEGASPGMIAYVDGGPVGWCSAGTKESFGRLARSRPLTPADTDPSPAGTWATLCFYVSPVQRRRGVARALLQGAMALAQQRGAGAYEVYPVRSEGRALANETAYPGTDQLLEGLGFREVTSAAPGRSSQRIMRRLFHPTQLQIGGVASMRCQPNE